MAKKKKQKRNPSYQQKIVGLMESGKLERGQTCHIHVYHDDWCGIFKGLDCNCNPDITPVKLGPGPSEG
jgi:hypothetical protein